MDQTAYEAAKARLREAATAYYTDGTSAIDDATYDALLAEVAAHEAAHGITDDVVGEAIASGAAVGGTVAHKVSMLSLDNVYDEAALRKWWTSIGSPGVVVEPKLDGLAMSVHYESGNPVQMLTRGDGVRGEEVTAAMPLLGLPERVLLPTNPLTRDLRPFTGEVRGEVIFSHDQFEAANTARVASGKVAFANPRNAAAGTVNRASKGGSVPDGTRLTFVAYGVEGLSSPRHFDAMLALQRAGFTTAQSLLSRADFSGVLDGDATLVRPALDFDIDGLVFKANEAAVREALGNTSRAPRWARAFKFPPDVARTKLIDVLWQVGRTGSVTPRAVVMPVSVGGTTITYASLHNPREVARLDLRIGDTVELRRAAEVIPQVMGPVASLRDGSETAIPVPTHCPNCAEPLLTDQARLRCPSGGECAAERKLTYAVGRDALDIEGMSTALVESLIAAGRLRDVADIFDLTATDIATCPTGRVTDGGSPIAFGDTIAAKVLAEVGRARSEATFERVLIALGLTGTGRSMSKRLAKHFVSMDALLAADADELAEVDKMGPVKSASLAAQLHALRPVIDRLRAAGLAMEVERDDTDTPKPLAGQVIVVTGTMRTLGSRSEVTGNLEALGAEVGSSVGSKTTLVVADDPDGSSSKLVKARKLGVRIVDEETFVAEFDL